MKRAQHDVSHVFPALKDFQRRTVDVAARELFGPGGTRRFLVADEVGLGKTVVARGLIARAIELHDAEERERTDILYICSNGDIARQNVRRLNVLRDQDFAHATRLTLLPEQLSDLATRPLNFVSFTPGTSFNLRSSEGIRQERVIVLRMLQRAWGSRFTWDDAAERVFAGSVQFDRFRDRASHTSGDSLDAALTAAFVDAVHGDPDHEALLEHFERLTAGVRRIPNGDALPPELTRERKRFIGRMRVLLARACVSALQPRLIILDEFQRFKHLLDAETEEGALAQELFTDSEVAVLLLSATPYKMFTRGDETEDHYADFLETVSFLRRDASAVEHLRRDIDAFRRGILQGDDIGHASARAAKVRIENGLRPVMSRNERVSVSPDASAMIETRSSRGARLSPDDVRRFRALRVLGRTVEAAGAMSYWESLPYPLSHLEDYHFGKQFRNALAKESQPFAGIDLASLSIDAEQLTGYAPIEAGNTRMRALEVDTVGSGMWELLWLPPSLPYYALSGVHANTELTPTKRLVFSKWRAVPRAIATHLSYAAEQRMVDGGAKPQNTAEDRKGHRPLVFGSGEQIRGMRTLALLLPSAVLAELGDPLRVVRALHRSGQGDGAPPLATVRSHVRAALAEPLAGLRRLEHSERGADERWYAAAPMLLDAAEESDGNLLRRWLTSRELVRVVADLEGENEDGERISRSEGLKGDLAALVRYLDGGAELGAMPEDLIDVLTDVAIAGPNTCALRALTRSAPDVEVRDPAVRTAAFRVADAMRTVFNSREVGILLNRMYGNIEAEQWHAALRYCAEGNLQSVLDEWVHVLHDGLATQVATDEARIDELSRTARDAIRIKTVQLHAQAITRPDEQSPYEAARIGMRANFALQFGNQQSETEKTLLRGAAIRTAFNSPFRPFVLATTSVGQEGLDFHVYCHAVVHWNLPRNPVDLEQREGRVHRYKNHAVRRNLASAHRAIAMTSDGDPWAAMFDAAATGREGDELVPYWVYLHGPARIERHVPALPLSREEGLHESLKRSTAAYRLVFGQPRQDDLLSYLEGATDVDLSDLTIDLKP
jgi:hypothetical protein